MPLIRVHVPTVRHLARFNVKRVLKVMPSVLLLLFVFSLIFVTLMQIAVIHSHRRSQFAPRQEQLNFTPPSYASVPAYSAQNLAKNLVIGTTPAKQILPKRPETLRVEAFLDKAAPSPEANAVIVHHLKNVIRIKSVLDSLRTSTSSACKSVIVKNPRGENDFLNHSSVHRELHSAQTLTTDTYSRTTPDSSDCTLNNPAKDSITATKRKTPCPRVPKLAGRLKVDLSSRNLSDVEDLLRRSPYMRGRGSWTPQKCTPNYRVAIIIPYRDRLEHLATLLYTLHPLLQRQLMEYKIYVVEQHGNETFNKGVLMNAGVREALREEDFHCFVFHDVDMIPEDDRNTYSCPPMPRHMSVAVDKFNYTLPYSLLVGGVFAIRLDHFLTVNGYSNLYWGWGGEDDDMAYRVKYRKLDIIRPPETIARFTMIKHDHRPESPNAIRTALLRMAKKRSPRDGLNTAKYRVIFKRQLLPYTHLMIDIGKHHRWQFLNGKRLIINF